MTVEQRVKDILLEILDVEEKEIVPTAHLRKDLGASSVDLVEILAALENEFDLEIEDEEAQNHILVVQKIADFIKEKTS